MRLPDAHSRALPCLALALATTVAACSGGGGSPNGPTTGPGGSGTACQSAPQPGDLPAWKAPATPPPIYPLIVANPGELTCGHNRVLFSFLDANNNVISAPDRTANIAAYDLGRDPTKAVARADGTFVWAIHDVRGIYIASLDFPEAGTYGAEFTTSVSGGAPETIRTTFSVDATTSLVQVGQQAPSTKTPTAADAGGKLTQISTDPTPDPAFYQVSADQALASHKAFVLIFATPKFCTSAQCGPTLDRIKPFATRYPTLAFIHTEPYELKLQDGQLQAVLDPKGNLTPTSVTNAWGLSSEPWVFVVDRAGVVRASFGLIFSDAELTAALDSVK